MSEAECILLARGSLQLPHEIYERYFAGLDAVALLRQSDDLVILPVRHAAGGGYILKRRNAAGDRVVSAADFFRAHGIDDDIERRLTVSWEVGLSALAAPGAFRL